MHSYLKCVYCPPGARVVKKAYPEERVGVFAQQGEGVAVVEYRCDPGLPSEMYMCYVPASVCNNRWRLHFT